MSDKLAHALFLIFAAAACGDQTAVPPAGNGGTASSAGAGNAGMQSAGGAVASGGLSTTGGASMAGSSPTGGAPATGGGSATGGSATSGGTAGTGAGAGGGTSGGSGGSGGCATGNVAGSEVILIGDSFIALNHSITNALQELARDAGALGPNETYREVAVSGTTMAGNQIPNQYTNAVSSSPVKVVLMNGGGNDCLQMNNAAGAVGPAESLFESMQQNGTESVVYFFYPDPVGNNFPNLKTCLDTLRPQMQSLCESLTSPKCYFIDLRPVWQGHEGEYVIQDGIHPTPAGGAAVADAVWEVMQQQCIAQ